MQMRAATLCQCLAKRATCQEASEMVVALGDVAASDPFVPCEAKVYARRDRLAQECATCLLSQRKCVIAKCVLV
ncbi:hypothetical protein EYF80_018827 [Liparis tanakae]|uniref:Uncharacterized protein n=1 Tax=Liparis tanakae TaxID=230148 RepID=A0A4Z2HZL5_9TELE|nr:hypothetical protein EYF80_018827 [Liparis tanakae]